MSEMSNLEVLWRGAVFIIHGLTLFCAKLVVTKLCEHCYRGAPGPGHGSFPSNVCWMHG